MTETRRRDPLMVRQVKMEYRLKEVTFEPMRAIV
jgi:hypothetical protein